MIEMTNREIVETYLTCKYSRSCAGCMFDGKPKLCSRFQDTISDFAFAASVNLLIDETDKKIKSMRCCANCGNNDSDHGDEVNCTLGVELEYHCDPKEDSSHWKEAN